MMKKRKLVLSTRFLSKKDQLVIKSLYNLLSNKLNSSWQISPQVEEGDVIICSKEQFFFVEDKFNFQLNVDNESSERSLRYPFRSDDFVEKLNGISE